MATEVYLEAGKAGTKVFACAVDWPGWCRAARTEDAALEALAAYADRYRPVVERAGLSWPRGASSFEVVERLPGTGATDFGVPDRHSSRDGRPLKAADARRLAALVGAAWATLDDVVASAPPVLRKGPRGGGRDRDAIAQHVVDAERSYARSVGLRFRQPEPAEVRAAFLEALAAARDAVPPSPPKAWPWRYAARRVAWHALDHAWEIEDKSG